jgi:hypothetical protein
MTRLAFGQSRLLLTPETSDLQNHRHDQRPSRRLLHDEALQVGADFFLHDAPVRHLFRVRSFKRPLQHLAGGLHQFRCTGEQLAAQIRDAVSSGCDLWVFDQFVPGPDRLERARKVLIEKRDACSDADEAAFLTSISRGLEKG